MIGEAEVLKPLVEECLDDDPAVRPTITTVCEKIQVSKGTYINKPSQNCINCINLYQLTEQMKNEIEQKDHTIEYLRAQMVM